MRFDDGLDHMDNLEEDSNLYEEPEEPQDEQLGIFCKQIMGVRPTTSTSNRAA